MIDTIFFLLVFFMMTTLSMVKLKGLNLNLPRPAFHGDKRPAGNVVISINDEGVVNLNKADVEVKDLPEKFTEAITASPHAAVVLNVSEAQKTQALVSTLDLLNELIAETGSSNPIIVATKKH
jgi:biopolymer transport protein ExbD